MSDPHTIHATDFTIANHGTLLILTPCTEPAHAWVAAHLPHDRLTWGRYGVVIEPRYVWQIVEGFREAGLTVAMST